MTMPPGNDPLSRRISKQVQYTDAHGEPHPTQTTCYGWDGDQQSADAWQNDNGQWQVRTTLYEPGSFVPLLRIDQSNLTSDPILLELKRQLADAGEPLPDELRDALSEDAGDCRYASYHTDHLGTPLALTDEHGHTLWEASPDDWAAVSNEQGNTDQPLRFQGQYQDEESGLYYNRHRYYDPQLGRYVNQDPIGLLGGMNTYAYPHAPKGWVDPLGLSAENACGDEKDLCYQQCIQRNYGSKWDVASSLNPLSVTGILGNEATTYLEDRAKREGVRQSYEDVRNRTGRPIYRTTSNRPRILRAAKTMRIFNLASLVLGVGAVSFQATGWTICKLECLGK